MSCFRNSSRNNKIQEGSSRTRLILTTIAVLALFFLLKLYFGNLSVWAADNDILIYYTRSFSSEIFVFDLNNLGFGVTIKYRANSDELGTTSASPINLMNYGQVWIIDACGGEDFTANEISAIKAFRDNGGGLLLSVDNPGCLERVNPITKEFNNNTGIFCATSSYASGDWCVSVSTTWPGHPTIHPLYENLTHLSSSNSDAKLNIKNSNIKVTVKHNNNAYGAVLDEPGKGRVIFDTSHVRFTRFWGSCSASSKSQYQQNIARYLRAAPCSWQDDNCGDPPCSPTEIRQTCGPSFCVGTCGSKNRGDTRCVPSSSCINFNLSSSGNIDLNINDTTIATSTISVSGTAGSVSLSVSSTDLPADTTFSFNPNSCVPNCSSTLTISLPSTTTAGTYSITVEGEDTSGAVASVTFSLRVRTTECGDGSCDFPEDSSTCPADCGCNHNARCEPERGENFWNCSDDCKALAESPCLCRADPKHLGGAGFVPCGRKADDLDTSNCECCPCTLCHAFLVFKRITDFLIKDLFFPLLVLAIIIAGILHIFGAIRITDITKAKAVLTAGAIGTMVIFTSWMTINFFLYFMIHEKTNEGIATIFSEPWSEISCNYPTEPCATAYCGDGIVQKPNSERVNEECERGEKWEAFKARAQAGEAIDVDSNGKIDEHDYFASICSCDEDCYLTADVSSCCGNGRWEAGEECDPTVSETDWLTSDYAEDLDGDGDRDSDDYRLLICYCKDNCIYTPGGETLNEFFNGSAIYTLDILSGQTSTAPVCLPENTKVCGASIKIRFSGSPAERTPYIWVPLSESNKLVQMNTSDGTIVKVYENNKDGFPSNAFNNPSRITLIPSGEVWVANRGNKYVTWLKPKPSPSKEYEYGGQVDMGQNFVRGVTYDANGNIWAGTCASANNRIKVICAKADCGGIGTVLATLNIGDKCVYGMIGDAYGIVWAVGGGEVKSYKYDGSEIKNIDTGSVPGQYGVGIDNNQNIWIGRWTGGTGVYKVSRDREGKILNISYFSGNDGAGGRGVAVDGDNNVWLVVDDSHSGWRGSSSRVLKFDNDGNQIANVKVGTGAVGVAVDANNNIWVVNYGGGYPNPPGCNGNCNNASITKLKDDGTVIATYGLGDYGRHPYNYSDMTGFRTPSLSLCIEGRCFPFSVDLPLTGFEKELQAALKDCAGGERVNCNTTPDCNIDFSGVTSATSCCKVPITIQASLGGGRYDLYNLDINYNPPP